MTDPDIVPASSDPLNRVAADLRRQLTRLIDELAGAPARPVRLMRQVGLDKSLASRLVKATKTVSDVDFMHQVPSPTGLRILLDAARPQVDANLHGAVEQAVDQFELLLDTLPGGRQALDAQLGESSVDIRQRREHMARQASFKAVSFLFGHYTETVCTSLFVLPASDGRHVELIEVHRRLGLHRVTPGTAMPLLSVSTAGLADIADQGPCMASLSGDVQTQQAADFLIESASSLPLPELQVEREGLVTTFVLPGDRASLPPARLTTAFRVLRANLLDPAQLRGLLRNYMLSTPCHRLVRDIYLAEGLWPGAQPQLSFYLPGPTGAPMSAPDPSRRHYRQLNLSAAIEPLPAWPAACKLHGVADQAEVLALVLGRAGQADRVFRGWRCELSYPVPLIEMHIHLQLPAG